MLGYDTALSVLEYLDREVEYLPWDAALDNLAYVNTQLKRTPGYGLFKVRPPHDPSVPSWEHMLASEAVTRFIRESNKIFQALQIRSEALHLVGQCL